MLQTLLNSNIPLIFVETDEPERVDFENPGKDLVGIWQEKTGIQYYLGGALEKIASTNTIEQALEYLAVTKKKFLMIFYGEPEYAKLSSVPDYHCMVFVYPNFQDHVGAVRIGLPLPDTEEYFAAFNKVYKTHDKHKKRYAEEAVGMKIKDAINCFLYSMHTQTEFLKNKSLFVKTNFLDLLDVKTTFEDLGGCFEFKEWFNKRKHWYRHENFPQQKGVLLYGPSGVGKSLAASCLGNESGIPTYKFDFTKVFDQFVGRSEEIMRSALKALEKAAPCVVVMEEIGRMFSGPSIQSNVAHHQVLAIFLDWLQFNTKNVFIAATANDIKNIPQELIRPGRFNAKFQIQLPNQEAREQIFKIQFKKYGIPVKLITEHAKVVPRMSGADIELAVQEAVIRSYSEDHAPSVILKEMLGVR